MIIESKRCIIRNFKEADAPALKAILGNPRVMEYIETPFTEEKTRNFIESKGLCQPPLVYALEYKEGNELIGQVIFHEYEGGSYEIGWIISDKYWNRGIADEITKSLIAFAKKSLLRALIIECDSRQKKSIKIAVKNGFRLIKDEGLHTYELLL